MTKDEQIFLLENMAAILIRCFFLSVGLLLLSFIFYILTGNWSFSISSNWYGFKMSRNEYDLLFYYGMAFIKTCIFIFFLIPYIAIKLVLRKQRDKI